MKKLLSIILSGIMIMSLSTFVSASPTYDVSKAMEYAASHVNDNDGSQCAEFVSKCVQAGGLSIPTKTGTKGCWDAILDASGLSGENLTLNTKGYVTKSDNENLLNRGDVVIQWCYTCDLRPHILICGGYDSEGYATFYAHNSALNNKRYNFSENSQHEASCNIGAKVVQISKLSNKVSSDSTLTPDNDTKPSNTSSKQKCGDNVYWELDNNGTLTISGSGEMYNQKNNVIYSSFPSNSSIVAMQSVKNIIIEEGITKIGEYAFVQMKNVKTVSIPLSVKTIEMGAFFYVTPDSITYAGSKEDWDKITINGQQSTMALGSHFFNALSFKENNDTKRTNIFASSTGKSYKIEAYKNGKLVSIANVSPDGYPESFSGDTQYQYFRPLYTNVNNVTCGDLPFGNITFKYENGKIIEVIGDENDILKRNDLNVEQSYIGYTWAPSLNYNSNNCIIESSYGSETKCWEYDESGRLKTYYVKGMAPTYYFYYDTSGYLKECEIAGPGSSTRYTFKYITSDDTSHSTEKEIKILINNKFLQCDQPPVLIDGRTLIPMRTIFEALGAEVSWDSNTNTATGTKEGKIVSFTINEKSIAINGIKKSLDVAAQLINNRTMIPVRAVAEAFDCDVNWISAKKFVVIIPKNQKPYRIEVIENVENKTQFTVDATVQVDDRGLIKKVDGGGDFVSWLAPLFANMNGNTYVNHIWGYREGYISMFGKLPSLEFSYDDGVLTKLNNYTYTYKDGLCIAATEGEQTDQWSFHYNDDLTFCTIKNKYPTTPTDTFTLNEMGLIKNHHFLLAGYKDINREFEYNSIGMVTKFNNIVFDYDEEGKLISASNGQKTVTYRYIYE